MVTLFFDFDDTLSEQEVPFTIVVVITKLLAAILILLPTKTVLSECCPHGDKSYLYNPVRNTLNCKGMKPKYAYSNYCDVTYIG